jgi:hypothetical protein
MLNGFELVVVQEDFAYHEELAADAEHPHQSDPLEGDFDLGDGLNRFSESPFDDFYREAWEECSGWIGDANDCLTAKGFSVGLHTLANGAEVDVYNLHMDAGGSQGDLDARAAQTEQLLDMIASRSTGRAIIVAGDTNMKEADEDTLQSLLEGAGLEDACRYLECGADYHIDRIMFRGSDALALDVLSWELDPAFVDGDGEDLSDHEALVVSFEWSLGGN